jgi:hypothetical protein
MSSKVIFQVEFTNQNFKFEIESYRQISEIKEKISKYLFPIKLDSYIITYNNKNIYSENIKASSLIGEVFKNKSFLKLKLIPREENSKSNLNKFNKESKTTDYNPDEDNYLKTVIVNVNEQTLDENQVKSKSDKDHLCTNCSKDKFSYYCRKCCYYICKRCLIKTHINHKTLSIDINSLEDGLKFLALNLKADSGICLSAMKGYRKIFDEKDLFEFKSRKKEIEDKLNELENKFQMMINSCPLINNRKDSNDYLNQVDLTYKKLNDEVDLILTAIEYAKKGTPINNKYKIGEKKLDIHSSKEIFLRVSELENEIEKSSQNVLSYKLRYDVTNQIENMYKSIISNINLNLKKEYNFSLDLSNEEKKYFGSEILSVLKQTANSGNLITNSIKSLYMVNNQYNIFKEDEKQTLKKVKNEEIIESVDIEENIK